MLQYSQLFFYDLHLHLDLCSHPPFQPPYEHKIVIIFPINLNMRFSAQKKCLFETVLLSTHNICFGCEIKKNSFQ